MTDPAQDAIACALKGDWESAIKINKSIISKNGSDVEALNRLARAYSETGDIEKAKTISKKVLKADPFNPIATKCLQKWSLSKRTTANGVFKNSSTTPKTFLEEPGKTKITALLNLGSSKTLAALDTGDSLKLNAHKHKVSAITMNGEYVGKLADDVSARIRKLIKMGYEYNVLVKSIDPSSVKIFIREVGRPDKFSDSPSFSPEKIDYVSFTPPELVHKKERAQIVEE